MADIFLSQASVFIFASLGAFFALVAPRIKTGVWRLSLPAVIVAFLGAGILPYGIVLVVYPVLSVKPNLSVFSSYLPLAGVALIWGSIVSVIQAVSEPITEAKKRAMVHSSSNESNREV